MLFFKKQYYMLLQAVKKKIEIPIMLSPSL